MSKRKEYLGDGAYADIEGGDLVLTAENGISATDRIVFEPYVLGCLTRYIKRNLDNEETRTAANAQATGSNRDIHVLQLQQQIEKALESMEGAGLDIQGKAAYLLDLVLTCDLSDPDLRIWYEAQKALDQQGEN